MSWLKRVAEDAARETNPEHRHDELGHTEVVAAAIMLIARRFAERAAEAACCAKGNGHPSDFVDAADEDKS
jgi:hypothetical protein